MKAKAALLCAVFIVGASVFGPSAPVQAASAGSTLLGVYYGNQGWAMDDVKALEAWQGKRHAVVNLFTHWDSTRHVMDNLFLRQLPAIWSNANVPLISWEPYLGGSTPTDIEVLIAQGRYDSYVTTWAARLKQFLAGPDGSYGTADDRRAYLRLAHEMNGNWYPWSAAVGANAPGDYVNMWRRVRSIFAGQGIDANHLQWIWAVNHLDVGGHAAEQYFPGHDAIDWVGVDGYNWGTSQSWSAWTSPEGVLGNMVQRLRAFTPRPLAITETGSSSAGGGTAAKEAWITSFFEYAVNNAGARMVSWFNTDKETDWAAFGGSAGTGTYRYGRKTYRTYNSYRTGVLRPELAPSTPSNPRLLTDLQFAGNLP